MSRLRRAAQQLLKEGLGLCTDETWYELKSAVAADTSDEVLAALEEQVAEFDKRLREYVEAGDDAIAGIAMAHHGDRMDRARTAIAKARGGG